MPRTNGVHEPFEVVSAEECVAIAIAMVSDGHEDLDGTPTAWATFVADDGTGMGFVATKRSETTLGASDQDGIQSSYDLVPQYWIGTPKV